MKAKLVGEGRTAEIWQHDDQRILKLYREDIAEQHVSREYKISHLYMRGVFGPLSLLSLLLNRIDKVSFFNKFRVPLY